MSDTTTISWCDATFNPWWGCSKVSPACDHCYAERDSKRFAPDRVLWGVGAERRLFGDKHWNEPLRWARTMPAKLGRRPRVFCASMGDWLDLDAPLDQFVRLLDTIRRTPELDWLLLSKRIGNWRKRVEEARVEARCDNRIDLHRWIAEWLDNKPPANVWIGSTVIDQAEADRDIPKLLAVPVRVRFLSIEPMLGPIDLHLDLTTIDERLRVQRAVSEYGGPHRMFSRGERIAWVIAGGESGPHARPAHPYWFRSLRDQCAAAGVPYHFKQWGEWWEVDSDGRDDETGDHRVVEVPGITASEWFDPKTDRLVAPDGRVFASLDDLPEGVRCRHMTRLGKAAAGRLLDGIEHNGFPA